MSEKTGENLIEIHALVNSSASVLFSFGYYGNSVM